MVCGGRSARPSRSAAARGSGMWSALYVRLLRGWRAKFLCGEGRAYVFTLWARAGAEGGADSPRSASVGLRRGEGGRVGGLAAIACTRGRKKKSEASESDSEPAPAKVLADSKMRLRAADSQAFARFASTIDLTVTVSS